MCPVTQLPAVVVIGGVVSVGVRQTCLRTVLVETAPQVTVVASS